MSTDNVTAEQMNIIIARFMNMEGTDRFLSLNYKYHEDWNQLIGAVLKIKEMKLRENWDRKKPVMNALYDVDINIQHKAVYDFITWYTTTKQKD